MKNSQFTYAEAWLSI